MPRNKATSTEQKPRPICFSPKRIIRRLRNCDSIIALKTDLENRIKFGDKCPLFAERLYIEPKLCEGVTLTKKKLLGWNRYTSGKVIGNWPIQQDEIVPVTELIKIKFCMDRWVNNVAWEHTGAYEFYEKR